MKYNKNKLLNELFSNARQQIAQISFESTVKQLKKSLNVSPILVGKWNSKLVKFNNYTENIINDKNTDLLNNYKKENA